MRGAHSPRDGGAGWGSPGTLSPGSSPPPSPSAGPQCILASGLPLVWLLARPKATSSRKRAVPGRGGCVGPPVGRWGARQAWAGARVHSCSPSLRGGGSQKLGEAWPAARGESPRHFLLGKRAQGSNNNHVCLPSWAPPRFPPWPPSALAPRPALQDADQTRPVAPLAGPGTAGRPVSATHYVHPRLPCRAVCVRTREPGARPPRKQRRAGDQGRVGAWPWASLLATGWALWGGPHAARPAGSGDEITLRAGGLAGWDRYAAAPARPGGPWAGLGRPRAHRDPPGMG